MELPEYEKIVPNVQAGGLIFLTPNQHCAWRVQTLYTKEPDTIEWLAAMKPGETLFDIGANMGQYAMLAAKSGVKVHAFEPEAQNFALLVRNIAVNDLPNLTAWPLALADEPDLAILHLSCMFPGGSCHSFGDSKDFHGAPKTFPYHQGSVSTTLDHFCTKFDFPNHIKIDVDGFEHLVLKGGPVTIARASTVLIEINTHYPEHMNFILPTMAQYGFKYDEAQAQSSRRKEGAFAGVGNIIFYKDN